MNPGMSVTSPRSITLAFAGTFTDPAAPTAVIMLSVTTTTALLIAAAPVPSIIRAAFRTTVPFPTGACGVICDTTAKHIEWISNNARQADLKFFNWFFLLSGYRTGYSHQQEIGMLVPNAAFT